MAGKPKEDEHEDRRHADKPPADQIEQQQTTPDGPPQGAPPYKD